MRWFRTALFAALISIFPIVLNAQTGGQVPLGARGDINPAVNPVSPLEQPAAALPSQTSTADTYVLGAGDRIRLTVYGEEDLSGEYEIGSTGGVALPLIGSVQAGGASVGDFEHAVQSRLAEGYLKDPRVSIQVVNYRPFFILGEVSKPGSYPYVNGMTVLNAVALAGGFTYRADKNDIMIVRAGDANKNEQEIEQNGAVMPGDVIRVPERFF